MVRQRSAKPLSPVQIRLPPLVPKGANCKYAGVAELADALDSKSSVPWDVSVRPRSPVFLETVRNSKVREIGLFSLQLQLKSVRNREVFAICLFFY